MQTFSSLLRNSQNIRACYILNHQIRCIYFVNCFLIQTLSPGLLGVYIQDGGQSEPAAILDFKFQKGPGHEFGVLPTDGREGPTVDIARHAFMQVY